MTTINLPVHRPSRGIVRDPRFAIGASLLLIWVLCALFSELFVPYSPTRVDVPAQLTPPSGEHWFGTDRLGRDVFSRVLTGSRDVLTVSVIAALLGTGLGSIVGSVAGYLGGWFDVATTRITEAVASIPSIVLALLILAVLGPSPVTLILTLAFTDIWVVARTARAAVQKVKQYDYVDAAWLRGERFPAVLAREILPNISEVLIVELTTRVAFAVFAVTSLSFLGFGVQPPSSDWGLQVADSYALLAAGYWWPTLFPALAIISLVGGITVLASSLTGRKG